MIINCFQAKEGYDQIKSNLLISLYIVVVVFFVCC